MAVDISVPPDLGWFYGAGTSQGTRSFQEGVFCVGRPSVIRRVSGWAAPRCSTLLHVKPLREALENTWRMSTVKRFSLDSTAEPIQEKETPS